MIRQIPSGIWIEAEIASLWNGALRPAELRSMPVSEVFDRFTAGKRLEAERRRFAIEAAAVAWMDKQGRANVQLRIDALARTEVERRSTFEVLPPAERIVQIGGNLKRFGDRWAKAHPSQMRWLQSEGVTRDQAIAAHAEWYRRTVVESPALINSRRELVEYREQLRRRVP